MGMVFRYKYKDLVSSHAAESKLERRKISRDRNTERFFCFFLPDVGYGDRFDSKKRKNLIRALKKDGGGGSQSTPEIQRIYNKKLHKVSVSGQSTGNNRRRKEGKNKYIS